MGIALSLLELMEKRAKRRNRTLAVVNQNLKSSQSRLIQSEKMASLGQMVAGVAHEINTPLGYVNSNVELARNFVQQIQQTITTSHQLVTALLDGTADDKTIGRLIQATNTQTHQVIHEGLLTDLDTLFDDSLHGLNQISELVVSLRNFSRIDHATISCVSLNDCIENALTIGRNIIKQKAEIERHFDEDVEIECVASQINQVLLNILTNAAQAITGFGSIKITTRSHPLYIDIHIRDNGCGMNETTRKKIFDPFFTTKAVGEGTGLGLSISYQIIQQHKGVIEVKSVVGKGTEFIIRLPRRYVYNHQHAATLLQ
jgi:signal transduction histidine kinase